jgi:hypothetical protein
LKGVINVGIVSNNSTTDAHHEFVMSLHDFGKRIFIGILNKTPQQVTVSWH